MESQSHGFIETIVTEGQTAVITGWAINPRLELAAETVHIKRHDGTLIEKTKPNLIRRDVAKTLNCESIVCCGWSTEISIAEIIPDKPIRAYAVVGDKEFLLSGSPDVMKSYPKMLAGYDLYTLIKRGLKVGEDFSMQPDCFIDYSHCWLITIGNSVRFAPRVQLIAHDGSLRGTTGQVKIGLINIGDNVFIGNGAIVLPGVSIGNNCVIGAGSVVTKNVPENSVAAGNPAKIICLTEELVRKSLAAHDTAIFDNTYTIERDISETMKADMITRLTENGRIGFINV